ncbi:MAG: Rne/Rng family ribonuclease [Parvibaculum sp.]|nr:Rne/Rng family ribonuclease [Parvibaculum sp.]
MKDPIGDKGARLSANVTIPGRLLVLVPNQSGVALSRRIEDEDERARLTALVEEMVERFNPMGVTGEPAGFIVRTAAIGATSEDIAADARQLAEEWRKVRETEKKSVPPSVVFHDLDPVSKTLRDCVSSQTSRVLIDCADAFTEAQNYCRRAMPEMLDRVQLFNGPGDLFSIYDVDGEIEAALEPRAELPSGGWITIETTEALTAIDVNSGRYTAATGLEETSVKINLEAVEEIVYQLRLRGTGGLIVIDFIHLNSPENIQKVLDALNTGFAKDRVPTQISAMSEFGLVEMTRKRVREPLDKLLTEPAFPHGRPRRKTCATVANDLLRKIAREAAAAPGRALVARASPEVVDWLERGNPYLVERLRRRVPAEVSLIGEPAYSREKIDVGALQ